MGYQTIDNNKKNQENNLQTLERNKYLDTTNFNIVQNLWQDNPSYTLYNESQKPLSNPPQPSYFMYIPAKLYYILKDGSRVSTLILLPISYENVISQVSTGKTIDEIETSVLSKNFYGKHGERDVRRKIYGKPLEDDIAFELRVYPFLAIFSHIQYTYKDSPQNLQDVKFLTTPWGKEILSDDRYEDLKEYTKNIAHFPENEMVVNGDENIYDHTFNYLDKEFSRLLLNRESKLSEEDKQRFYVLSGVKWNIDDLNKNKTFNIEEEMKKYKSFEEFQQKMQNEYNFNGLSSYLSNKVVFAKDPLYPD